MSRRFPEFSRLFWQPLKRPPRLHPAMRARMWKPGQSGNPSGVSRAYAEARREMSMRPIELSPGAERTRRWREKRQQGVVVVHVDVASDVAGKLVSLGWLDASRRGDKEAITRAFTELSKTTPRGARPWRKGQAPNPTGKSGDYHEALKLARKTSMRSITRLIELRESEDEQIATVASKALWEISWGKPQVFDPKAEALEEQKTRNSFDPRR